MQSVQYPLHAPAGADVIVIAGDLTHAERVGAELRLIVDRYGMPVVFVPGNHEYFVHPHRSGYRRGILNDRLTMSRLSHDLRDAGQFVYVLDDSEMVLGESDFLVRRFGQTSLTTTKEVASGTVRGEPLLET